MSAGSGAAPRSLTRRTGFWIAYALIAAIALGVALKLFPLAIPLLELDIRMTRHEAVTRAEAIAQSLALAPDHVRSAVRFVHDDTMQNYVELEGGGKRAFAELIASNAYAPYVWEVRLFAPGEIGEVLVRFRPDGAPYGFTRKVAEAYLPEDAAARALTTEAARAVAERDAVQHWNFDVAAYRPLNETQERQPNGRVDHVFEYQRSDAAAGEARFRVRLTVTGDRLTEVAHFGFVPESFERRFTELRAANNTIAGAAGLAAGVLYGLGGCILGVLWLMRRHWLAWRPALVAGLIVGGLLGAASLASAPGAWFGYDTAEPVSTFWVRQVGSALVIFIGGGLGYALVFMAAESLSRRAFAHHPQVWKLWGREAAATPEVLGRTVGGYLFVALELAFIALFYYATNRWLGWWQPSESLTDPNILGSAVPALSPIAMALQAGFMEECLFRAVPLSLAALIGARFGRRNLAIGIAIVVQALVFGGGHANYPGFPAYSRLVELLLPSLVWALLFLRFGLLVTILLHVLFDLALMSIPLFLVDAPGSSLQRALVIAAGLVPLAIVLVQRWRAGAWHPFPQRLRNGAWQPSALPDEPAPAFEAPQRPATGWVLGLHRILPALGLAGLVLWAATTSFRADVPTLPIGRAEAVAAAEAALAARQVVLGDDWRRFARVRLAAQESPQSDWHEFVWREGGPDVYAALMGNILAPPVWEVRFARFDGDVAERAEEWRVSVQGDGRVRQVRHALPEGRAGASLDRDAALVIARRAVREDLAMDPDALRLIGAEQKQQPSRRDWTFMFMDPARTIGAGGEPRVQVIVAGDAVGNAGRYVHIPEAWERTQKERDSRLSFAKLGLAAFTGVVLVAGLVFGATQWMRRRYDRRVLRTVSIISFLVALATMANSWPQMAFNLRTSEPVVTQAGLSLVAGTFGALVVALLVGFVTAIGAWTAVQRPATSFAGRWPAWLAGCSAALIVAGLEAGLSALASQGEPIWPTYTLVGQAIPLLGAVFTGLGALGAIGGGLFVLAWLTHLTGGWRRHLWLAAGVLVVALMTVAVVGAGNPLAAMIGGLVAGVAAIVIVYGVLRFDLRSVPAYITTGMVLAIFESAVRNAIMSSYVQAAVAIVVALVVTVAITRYLQRRAPDSVATT
ncbi:MAG: CPBP family intramembrane glutamic endopeptidase [Casimicrobiaceae bacterium]